MKHVGTVLMALALSTSASAQSETSIKFDKFKNTTRFSIGETRTSKVTYDGGKDVSLLIHKMEVSAGFSCEGQVDNCKPADVELLFIASTSDWQMQGKHVVNLLIDGKPATAGKSDWDGQVLEAENLVEYNDVTINPELLAKLAGAKTVDVQIGVFEFSLTSENIESLRNLAGHIGASKASK